MNIIIDASCIIAVLLGEDEAPAVKNKTRVMNLVSPLCLPFEIGNSLTSSVKRHRIAADIAPEVFKEFKKMPIRLLELDIEKAVQIAAEENHYAYDAYYIECALEKRASVIFFG